MATAENALIKIEGGRSLVTYEAMTDSGNHTTYTYTSGAVVSGMAGFTPDISPNGIVTGTLLGSPAVSLTNDLVDVAAFTAYSIGVLHTVSASVDVAITRPATAVSKVNSVTMTNAGAVAVVAGVDGTTTAFSAVRGAAGGPP